MKSVLRSLAWAAAGVLAYLFLPDLFLAAKEWPWGKILLITSLVVGVCCVWALVISAVGLVEVGSAIIRIADKIAPREKK